MRSLSSTSPRLAAGNPVTITTALEQVLAKEACSNELKLTYVKAVVLCISTALDTLVFFFPKTLVGQDQVSPTIMVIGLGACLFSIFLIKLLRQARSYTYLRQLQLLIPLADSLILGAFITNIWRVFGVTKPLIITNVTAFCCLLAVSGGLRLSRRAAGVTTLLALLNFFYAVILFKLEITIALFAGFTIFGIGFLGMWMATIVQRHVKNEAGRVLMERFLPKSVVQAAFEAPLDLLQQPRLCEVTIVVTDLRSFTQFSEKLAPQEVLTFLNIYQGLLSKIVERYGGWVDKFMGDGMLAVFGAPEQLDNHAENALLAATAMVQEVSSISPLGIGIGIHSGLVVAGCLGTGGHLEFTVIGDTVNVASRLEALTKQLGHAVLISDATCQRLDQWPLKSLGLHTLRGRADDLEIFAL